jgi:hypothetical protein
MHGNKIHVFLTFALDGRWTVDTNFHYTSKIFRIEKDSSTTQKSGNKLILFHCICSERMAETKNFRNLTQEFTIRPYHVSTAMGMPTAVQVLLKAALPGWPPTNKFSVSMPESVTMDCTWDSLSLWWYSTKDPNQSSLTDCEWINNWVL